MMNRSRSPRNWPENRQASPVDDLNRSIAELEARIEGLNNRSRTASARSENMGTASEMVMRQRLMEREQRGRQHPPQPAPAPPQPAPVPPRPRVEAPNPHNAATQNAMRETGGAMRDIAEALVSLRDDLRQDISENMSREFGSLRRDVDEIKALSGAAAARPDVGHDLSENINREFGSLRRDVDEIKALSGAAAARPDVSHDLSENINREFGSLRRDVDEIKALSGAAAARSDVSQDLAQLSNQLELMESRRSDNQSDELHAELDELRTMVNELAREDSMRRLETRWDGFEERISGMDSAPIREDLITLSYRLDDIKSSIGQLPSALPIHALEDKIKMLVAAIDAMARQPGAADPEVARQFAMLDERLDEISRAIVATSVSRPAGVEAADIQRLETRLDAVVDHIGRLGQSEQDDELAHRIEALSLRVEELAGEQAYGALVDRIDLLSQSLADQPPSTDPQLIGQLEDISRKVDTLDLGAVNEHLADQLKALSMRIDNINGDLTATNSNQDMLYGRIEDLAVQVGESIAEQGKIDLGPLEARLADIATRLDDNQAQHIPSDDAIRDLESQVAGLTQLLAPTGDQLDGDQDQVIGSARQAAEGAIASYRQGGAPAADVSAIESLVGDLRSLEVLSRKSEERNSRTIDAVHDTLLKIAGRLENLEGASDASSPVSDPAAEPVMAADLHAASAVYPPDPAPSVAEILPQERDDLPVEGPVSSDKAFLSGLVQRMKGSKDKPQPSMEHALQDIEGAPSIDPVGDIDPDTANMPLEPGSGAPDIKRIMAKVREAQNMAEDDNPYPAETNQAKADKADFIAAARRAARAAATEAASLDQSPEEDAKPGSLREKISRARRPLLLAAGAILLAVLSYPLVSGYIGGKSSSTQTAAVENPAIIEPQTPPVTEPVAGTEEILPEVRVTETAEDTDGGILVTRQSEATLDPGSSQVLSTSNEVQYSDSFVHAGTSKPDDAGSSGTEMASVASEPSNPAPTTMAPTESSLSAKTIEMPPAAAGPLALREAAASGDGLALFEIGARYTDGRGVPADFKEAAKWYQYSADLGFAPAQYRLANFYEKGTGVERDLAKALTWYQMAAEQGNASAMHNLAVLHAMGRNGVADYDSAGTWFTKAADLGVKDSQFNLAILHARGSGVQQDLEESYKWFAIAAKTGDKDAAKKRDEVANALRPEQLESARAKVELWKPAALIEEANSVAVPADWRGVDTRTASVDMKKAVRNIQAILTKNGFDTGGVDGVMGNNTITAIKAFQTSVGLEPTGEVDDALVKELLARNK
jgi:localization factor PodJL